MVQPQTVWWRVLAVSTGYNMYIQSTLSLHAYSLKFNRDRGYYCMACAAVSFLSCNGCMTVISSSLCVSMIGKGS